MCSGLSFHIAWCFFIYYHLLLAAAYCFVNVYLPLTTHFSDNEIQVFKKKRNLELLIEMLCWIFFFKRDMPYQFYVT